MDGMTNQGYELKELEDRCLNDTSSLSINPIIDPENEAPVFAEKTVR